MNDLISRTKLLEDLQNTITENSGTIDWLNMISRQPKISLEEHDKEIRDKAIEEYQKECIKFIMNKRKVLIEELQRRADENAIAAIVADTRTVSCYKTGIKEGLKEAIEIIDEIAEQMEEVGE